MSFQKKIIVTTTPSIAGWEIKAYYGIISSHAVAGTNIFSDIFADFSDFFGGRSGSYQKQISAIHNHAIDELKKKAHLLGGNCIVGLHIDHDEISGKDKSMFMVTAMGTAVRAEKLQPQDSKSHEKPLALAATELKILSRKKEIIEASKSTEFSYDETIWQFITEHQVSEIATCIVKKLHESNSVEHGLRYDIEFQETSEFRDSSQRYFLSLSSEKTKEILYNALIDTLNIFDFAKDTISKGQLLDYNFIKQMLESKNFITQKQALSILECDKDVYTKEDIEALQQIVLKIKSIFLVRVNYVEETSLLSNNPKKKWVCDCGKKNDNATNNCSACDQDIYGFTTKEVTPPTILNLLKNQILILEEYLT